MGNKNQKLIQGLQQIGFEQNSISPLVEKMEKYINESSAKFITGQWDIDTMWDSYVSTLKSMDMEYIWEILQPYWDAYVSK